MSSVTENGRSNPTIQIEHAVPADLLQELTDEEVRAFVAGRGVRAAFLDLPGGVDWGAAPDLVICRHGIAFLTLYDATNQARMMKCAPPQSANDSQEAAE
jgi:hypothetical protein